jgi:ABC-2 type transport system permease protein
MIGHEVEAAWAITWRDLKRFARDRNQVLGSLARPALWLVFMGKGMRAAVGEVGGIDYQHFVFAGAIAMSILFSGMFQSVSIIWDREFGFLKEILVAPVSRVTIVVGKTLSGAAVTFLQGAVAVAFAPFVSVRMGAIQIGALLGAVALLSVAFTALGVVVATRMETFEGFGVISNFVVLPLYFLSGGVFPIGHLPGWMAFLVHVNPLTYGVDLMRHAIGQPTVFAAALDLGIVACFGALMLVAALAWFRRE